MKLYPNIFGKNYKSMGNNISDEVGNTWFDEKTDKLLMDEAVRLLQEADRENRPLAIYMHAATTHWPYCYPPKFSKHKPDPARSLNAYRNSIEYADFLFNNFTTQLKQLGLWDHTVFTLTGDHGECFLDLNEQKSHAIIDALSGARSCLHRVPFGIHLPNLKNNVKRVSRSSHPEIFPTVLDYLQMNASSCSAYGIFGGKSLLSPSLDATRIHAVYSATFPVQPSVCWITDGTLFIVVDSIHSCRSTCTFEPLFRTDALDTEGRKVPASAEDLQHMEIMLDKFAVQVEKIPVNVEELWTTCDYFSNG